MDTGQLCLLNLEVWASEVQCSLLLLPFCGFNCCLLFSCPINPSTSMASLPSVDEARHAWSVVSHQLPPVGPVSCPWDFPIISSTADSMLNNSQDPISKAHLLSVSSKESGVWLNATPGSYFRPQLCHQNCYLPASRLAVMQSTLPHCGAEVTEFARPGTMHETIAQSTHCPQQ